MNFFFPPNLDRFINSMTIQLFMASRGKKQKKKTIAGSILIDLCLHWKSIRLFIASNDV